MYDIGKAQIKMHYAKTKRKLDLNNSNNATNSGTQCFVNTVFQSSFLPLY